MMYTTYVFKSIYKKCLYISPYVKTNYFTVAAHIATWSTMPPYTKNGIFQFWRTESSSGWLHEVN